MSEPEELLALQIQSRLDLSAYILQLSWSLSHDVAENVHLGRYLRTLAVRIGGLAEPRMDRGRTVTSLPTWELIGRMLREAQVGSLESRPASEVAGLSGQGAESGWCARLSLSQAVWEIESSEDLAAFVMQLSGDVEEQPGTWENPELGRYLEALAAWTRDMDGYFKNRGEEVPARPTWRLVGMMLLAAKYYE